MVENIQQETHRIYHGDGNRYKPISKKVETLRAEKEGGQTQIRCADERAAEEVRNALRDAGIPLRDDLPDQRRQENFVFIDNEPTKRAMGSLGKYAAETYGQSFEGKMTINQQTFDFDEPLKAKSANKVRSGIKTFSPEQYGQEIHATREFEEKIPGAIANNIMTNFPRDFPQKEEIEKAIKADLEARFKEFKAEEQALQQNGGILTLATAALAEKGLITAADKAAIIATEKEVLQQRKVEPENAVVTEFETSPGINNLIDVGLEGSNEITAIRETGQSVQIIAHPKTAKLMGEMLGTPVKQFSDTKEQYVELKGNLQEVAPQLAECRFISDELNQRIQAKAEEMERTPPGAKEAVGVDLKNLGVKVKAEVGDPQPGKVSPGETPEIPEKGTGTIGM